MKYFHRRQYLEVPIFVFQARRRFFSHSLFPNVIPCWTASVFIGGHCPLSSRFTLLTERYSRYPWASMLESVLLRYSAKWLPLLEVWAWPWSVSASSWPSTTTVKRRRSGDEYSGDGYSYSSKYINISNPMQWWLAGPSGTWQPASPPDWSGSTVVTGITRPQ